MKEKHAQGEKERPAHADAEGQDALDWVRQLTYGGRGSEQDNERRAEAGTGAGVEAGASSTSPGALTLARVSLAVAAEALPPVKIAFGLAAAVSAGASALREGKWLEEKIEGSPEARAKTTERTSAAHFPWAESYSRNFVDRLCASCVPQANQYSLPSTGDRSGI